VRTDGPDGKQHEYPIAYTFGVQPLQQLGRPSDIANAALYFASDAARHITGQLLSIGGGDYMPS